MHKISLKIKYFVSYRLKILNSLKLYTDGLFGWISNNWIKPSNLVKQNKVGWRKRDGRKVGEKASS